MAAKKTVSKTTITRKTSTSGTSSSKSSGDAKKAASSSITKDLILGSVAVLALTAALSYNFVKSTVVDMGFFLGDLHPLNTAGCEPVKGLQACEDIHIHHASGLAFATCGNAESRKSWYPPMGATNASASESAFQDKFVIYDITSGEYEVKELVGLPAGTDRVFHGLGVFERSATELTIFAVNHRRTGSVVEVLEYTIGSSEVRYIETIQHDLIHTPNDIVATGPRSFYVTNDHLHHSGPMRHVEGLQNGHGLQVIVGPSKVVKLSKNPLAETLPSAPRHVVDTVLFDDGNLISTGTVAAVDRKRGAMLVGTAFGTLGLIRCPIPKSA
ncbi:hypothetical protein BGZ70_004837 [Mortierella alpina]|uniref:Arylesterase n=1 Tax=Mortierella alpina TaxID=64518 RepID=A0A9P6IQT7_MORAP|nr:hypothetical protein BGZ70_004837 [Mortierella alpina]